MGLNAPVFEINRSYTMPFGKHEGILISQVPTPYLRWLLAQAWVEDHTRFEVMDELSKRKQVYNEAVMEIINLRAEIKRLRETAVKHKGYVPGRDEV
jgi:hypothetical protein